MVFKSVMKLDNDDKPHWYLNEFTLSDVGTWYSCDRGVYLVPDIIIDAIANGYRDSDYEYIVNLHKNHPKVFSDEYNDIRDVMLLDDWIYEDMSNVEQWLNDHDKFIIPEGYYIGFNEYSGDFGMWLINDIDDTDNEEDEINE